MKAILIDSTNKMMLRNFENIPGHLSINGKAFWQKSISTCFSTSLVKNYKVIDKNIVELYTLNSTYVFRLINCEFDNSGIKNIEQSIVDEHISMKSKLSKKWLCQLDGGLLQWVISSVTLKEPMNIDEAREYVMANNIKDDNENSAIATILEAIDDD